MRKYKIYMMSARNIISYAEKDSDGIYKFNLQVRETEKCKVPTASHEQESNALFYQIMCHLHGDNFEFPEDILIRSTNHGVNRYKIMPDFLP